MSESPGGRFGTVLAQATGRVMEPGHRVQVVRNGAVFDALESLIASAEKSLHLSIYMWKPGHASDRVLHAIEARRRAGLPVRIAVDRWGSRSGFTSSVQPHLEQFGCEVRLYGTGSTATIHRSIVVTDGRRALTGGFGVWDRFLGDGQAREEWRDTNIRVDGPAVRFMQKAFLDDWLAAGGSLPPLDELARPVPAGAVVAAFVDNSRKGFGHTRAHDLMGALLPWAKTRLWISSAYFAPEPDVVEALIARARANTDVRVLVPGPIHEVPPIREAGRATYRRLLEGGVRIWEYQPSMFHAKTAVVDDDLSVVGSINLEPHFMTLLEEGSLVFRSQEIAAELARDFEADLGRAQEITPETIPAPELKPGRQLFRRVGSWVIRGLRGRRRELDTATSDAG